MTDIADIPHLKTRAERYEAIFVDSYGDYEQLSSMSVYFTDAVTYPFEAEWRDAGEAGSGEHVTVLGYADLHDRHGVLLTIQRGKGKPRRVPADQLWATKKKSANAIVLDDYRHWFDPNVFGGEEE